MQRVEFYKDSCTKMPFLVSDYMGMSLKQFCHSDIFTEKKTMSPKSQSGLSHKRLDAVYNIAVKLVEIVSVLHKLQWEGNNGNMVQFIHRDLNTNNITIARNGDIGIIDFGLSAGMTI